MIIPPSTTELEQELTSFFRRNLDRLPVIRGVPEPFKATSEIIVVEGRRRELGPEPEQTPIIPQQVLNAPAAGIGSVDPNNGKLAGGTSLRITGTNFQNGVQIFIDNVLANNIEFISATLLLCKSPAYTHGTPDAVTVDVKIVNPSAPAIVKTGAFNYYNSPSLSIVVPATGPGVGGTDVTLNGSRFIFSAGYTAYFGGAAVPATRVDSHNLTCRTPAHDPGTVNVIVQAPDADQQTSNLAGGYIYTSPGSGVGLDWPYPSPPVIPPHTGYAPGAYSVQDGGLYTLNIEAHVYANDDLDALFAGIFTIFGSTYYATIEFDSPNVQMHFGQGSFQFTPRLTLGNPGIGFIDILWVVPTLPSPYNFLQIFHLEVHPS